MTITPPKVWTEKYLQMNHGRTRYWEAGTGTPTILLHGAGWNAGCENWSLAMAPLSQHLRVLAMDCLNWATGDVLDQEFSFAYLVDHVREFMDALHIGRANIVGHSMGGMPRGSRHANRNRNSEREAHRLRKHRPRRAVGAAGSIRDRRPGVPDRID